MSKHCEIYVKLDAFKDIVPINVYSSDGNIVLGLKDAHLFASGATFNEAIEMLDDTVRETYNLLTERDLSPVMQRVFCFLYENLREEIRDANSAK